MKNFRYVMTGIATISLLGVATASYANGGTDACYGTDEFGNAYIDMLPERVETGGEPCVPYRDPPVRGDNGWGNGDDVAPGNSATNNNAENADSTDTSNDDGTNGGTTGPGKSTQNGNQGL